MEEATVDHDIKLRKLLQRCRDRGMRLNAGKLNLRQTSISFLGHMITSDGLLPDPEKIEAIKEMPCPTVNATIRWIRELPGKISATYI